MNNHNTYIALSFFFFFSFYRHLFHRGRKCKEIMGAVVPVISYGEKEHFFTPHSPMLQKSSCFKCKIFFLIHLNCSFNFALFNLENYFIFKMDFSFAQVHILYAIIGSSKDVKWVTRYTLRILRSKPMTI